MFVLDGFKDGDYFEILQVMDGPGLFERNPCPRQHAVNVGI